jgi:hypothetical protein
MRNFGWFFLVFVGLFARELTPNRFRWFTCTGEWETSYHYGMAGSTEKREIKIQGSSRGLPFLG